MSKQRATITAVGHYVPDKILTNADLEKIVDTSDEWIRTRTGIVERRVLEEGGTSDMAARAVQAMLKNRGISADEIDLIICATISPDMFFPSTACLIQEKIGARNAWGFDLSGACSGFVYGVATAAQFIEAGTYKKVVLVGSDKMTSITDYTDRNNCILFGDAAAAVLVEASDDPTSGILDYLLYSDGSGGKFLNMKAGGSLMPASHETVDKRLHYIFQDGKAVFKVAVVKMAEVAAQIMAKHHLSGNDIDWLVPHQANKRIIDATAERMGLEKSKVMVNIDRYGNTTAATIPLCLSEWWQQGLLKKGHRLVFASFGAGYTWGSVLVKWTVDNCAKN
ncbi:MAG TPA: beta-ketoacyl-ACP synthase III [Bacteroidota bacterium]|nr:beta-ketoacyl-ACP synthase III [Bacteroidota bacterium]